MTPEPSGPAMRAAEQINAMLCEQGHCRAEAWPVLIEPLATIIERETGAGEAVAVIKDLMGQWSPMAPEYDRARAFLARFNR